MRFQDPGQHVWELEHGIAADYVPQYSTVDLHGGPEDGTSLPSLGPLHYGAMVQTVARVKLHWWQRAQWVTAVYRVTEEYGEYGHANFVGVLR